MVLIEKLQKIQINIENEISIDKFKLFLWMLCL
jgi:hypothetical protein